MATAAHQELVVILLKSIKLATLRFLHCDLMTCWFPGCPTVPLLGSRACAPACVCTLCSAGTFLQKDPWSLVFTQCEIPIKDRFINTFLSSGVIMLKWCTAPCFPWEENNQVKASILWLVKKGIITITLGNIHTLWTMACFSKPLHGSTGWL